MKTSRRELFGLFVAAPVALALGVSAKSRFLSGPVADRVNDWIDLSRSRVHDFSKDGFKIGLWAEDAGRAHSKTKVDLAVKALERWS